MSHTNIFTIVTEVLPEHFSKRGCTVWTVCNVGAPGSRSCRNVCRFSWFRCSWAHNLQRIKTGYDNSFVPFQIHLSLSLHLTLHKLCSWESVVK